jgi:hypothetical protein
VLFRVLGLGSGSGERCERSGVVFLHYFVHDTHRNVRMRFVTRSTSSVYD